MWFVSGDDGGLPLFTPKPQPHHITPMYDLEHIACGIADYILRLELGTGVIMSNTVPCGANAEIEQHHSLEMVSIRSRN